MSFKWKGYTQHAWLLLRSAATRVALVDTLPMQKNLDDWRADKEILQTLGWQTYPECSNKTATATMSPESMTAPLVVPMILPQISETRSTLPHVKSFCCDARTHKRCVINDMRHICRKKVPRWMLQHTWCTSVAASTKMTGSRKYLMKGVNSLNIFVSSGKNLFNIRPAKTGPSTTCSNESSDGMPLLKKKKSGKRKTEKDESYTTCNAFLYDQKDTQFSALWILLETLITFCTPT